MSGLPHHVLTLKKNRFSGIGIKGLLNGASSIVGKMYDDIMVLKALTGVNIEKRIWLPHTDWSLSDITMPFSFKRRRRQFTIKLTFCIIKKEQGQLA